MISFFYNFADIPYFSLIVVNCCLYEKLSSRDHRRHLESQEDLPRLILNIIRKSGCLLSKIKKKCWQKHNLKPNPFLMHFVARLHCFLFMPCFSSWCVNASWRVKRRRCSSCPKSWTHANRRETSTSWWPTSWESATRDWRRSTGNLLWVVQHEGKKIELNKNLICILLLILRTLINAYLTTFSCYCGI